MMGLHLSAVFSSAPKSFLLQVLRLQARRWAERANVKQNVSDHHVVKVKVMQRF